MKKLIITFISTFILSISLEAVLPPLYQSIDEVQAIFKDDQLGQKLSSGETLISIERNDRGYEIVTNKHHLQVNIRYKKLEQPGPAQFDLQFENPEVVKDQFYE